MLTSTDPSKCPFSSILNHYTKSFSSILWFLQVQMVASTLQLPVPNHVLLHSIFHAISAAGTSSTITAPSSATPSTFSPLTSNTTNGVLGGIGPTGTTSSLDGSNGGLQLEGIGSLPTVLLTILVLLKI
ncbi:hypothetical protein BHE74_00001113 [Ensete ventricosum]|nr:hypothetical protein GW17_00001644 [Ensete ventricosum]RWW89843.1 hypothetical protein BHE74_00001113 [Ensete ventricosum]